MSHLNIQGSVALVTGANRGIGRAIVDALLERGISKVYAGARKVASLDELVNAHGDRVVAIALDVTDADQVAAAAAQAKDVRLLFNNAGVAIGGGLTDDNIVDVARQEMEVNYFAPLHMVQQFGATLAANDGAVINVASVAGLTNFPFFATYSASKAAVHSLTQAIRALMAPQGIASFGVYPGPIDTDMAKGLEMDKATPESTAHAILDGIEAGTEDILPDPFAVGFGEQFQASPKTSEQQIAAMLQEH